MTERRERILDALDRLFEAWPRSEAFAHAVAESVARHGYARADVVAQLRHVALRSRGRTMRLVLEQELGAQADLSGAPARVLVLASGRMPGLSIEGVAAALAVGAVALVRPSRDETVLHHLLAGLRASEPELMTRIEVVATDGGEPAWEQADAAVVFGSDETIGLVRRRLRPAAAGRIAGYGSRQGIAVVGRSADEEASWAERLADDVLAFRQAGCMSPSWVFVMGDEERVRHVRDRIGRQLARVAPRHVAPGVDLRMQQRRSVDADVLSAIAAGEAGDASVLHAGDARLTIVGCAGPDELTARVARLGSLLQTAVVASGTQERAALGDLLVAAGATRTCLPGQAHQPDPLWPQDGVGRVAPLLA